MEGVLERASDRDCMQHPNPPLTVSESTPSMKEDAFCCAVFSSVVSAEAEVPGVRNSCRTSCRLSSASSGDAAEVTWAPQPLPPRHLVDHCHRHRHRHRHRHPCTCPSSKARQAAHPLRQRAIGSPSPGLTRPGSAQPAAATPVAPLPGCPLRGHPDEVVPSRNQSSSTYVRRLALFPQISPACLAEQRLHRPVRLRPAAKLMLDLQVRNPTDDQGNPAAVILRFSKGLLT